MPHFFHSLAVFVWISLLFVFANSKVSLWLALTIPFLYYRNYQRQLGYVMNRNKTNFEGMYTPIIAGQIRLKLGMGDALP